MEFARGIAKDVKKKFYKKDGSTTVEKSYTTSADTNITVNSKFSIHDEDISFTKRRGDRNINISNGDDVLVVGNKINSILVGVSYHNFTKNISEVMSKKSIIIYLALSIGAFLTFAIIVFVAITQNVSAIIYVLAVFAIVFSLISFSIFKTGNSARNLLRYKMQEGKSKIL